VPRRGAGDSTASQRHCSQAGRKIRATTHSSRHIVDTAPHRASAASGAPLPPGLLMPRLSPFARCPSPPTCATPALYPLPTARLLLCPYHLLAALPATPPRCHQRHAVSPRAIMKGALGTTPLHRHTTAFFLRPSSPILRSPLGRAQRSDIMPRWFISFSVSAARLMIGAPTTAGAGSVTAFARGWVWYAIIAYRDAFAKKKNIAYIIPGSNDLKLRLCSACHRGSPRRYSVRCAHKIFTRISSVPRREGDGVTTYAPPHLPALCLAP